MESKIDSEWIGLRAAARRNLETRDYEEDSLAKRLDWNWGGRGDTGT